VVGTARYLFFGGGFRRCVRWFPAALGADWTHGGHGRSTFRMRSALWAGTSRNGMVPERDRPPTYSHPYRRST